MKQRESKFPYTKTELQPFIKIRTLSEQERNVVCKGGNLSSSGAETYAGLFPALRALPCLLYTHMETTNPFLENSSTRALSRIRDATDVARKSMMAFGCQLGGIHKLRHMLRGRRRSTKCDIV